MKQASTLNIESKQANEFMKLDRLDPNEPPALIINPPQPRKLDSEEILNQSICQNCNKKMKHKKNFKGQ